MYENSNIPAGANTPDAPWNDAPIQEREFDIDASFTIKRSTTVKTNDYVPEFDDETGVTHANTRNTDWRKVYANQDFTPLDLIAELKSYVTEDMKGTAVNSSKGQYLKRLLAACDGWELVDDDYE